MSRERKLRAALMEFVRVERSFGHDGQHADSQCADCKRVRQASDALSHGYLWQDIELAMLQLTNLHWSIHTCDAGYRCQIYQAPERGEELLGDGIANTVQEAIHLAYSAYSRKEIEAFHAQ